MKSYLLIAVFFITSNVIHAQQVATIEPDTYSYSLTISDIGSWSNDATIKTVQTALKPIFEVIVPMNDAGEFKVTTAFEINEEKAGIIIQRAGFNMSSFEKQSEYNTLQLAE